MINDPLADMLGPLHGKRPEDIFVIISKDGSTIVKDPGLVRPWSSPFKNLAEEHAKIIKSQGFDCVVTDLKTAIKSVLNHPKNLPPGLPPGWRLPDSELPKA